MIAHSKTKSGKLLSHGTAKITSDPQYRETSTGKQVTSFYVLSDAVGFGKNKEYESYKINAWGELAVFARNFEKGDVIHVDGECKRDEYASNKNGKDDQTNALKGISKEKPLNQSPRNQNRCHSDIR